MTFHRPSPSFKPAELWALAERYVHENADTDKDKMFMLLLDVADCYMGMVERDNHRDEVARLTGEQVGASLGTAAGMSPMEIMLNGIQDHMEMRTDGSYPRLYQEES